MCTGADKTRSRSQRVEPTTPGCLHRKMTATDNGTGHPSCEAQEPRPICRKRADSRCSLTPALGVVLVTEGGSRQCRFASFVLVALEPLTRDSASVRYGIPHEVSRRQSMARGITMTFGCRSSLPVLGLSKPHAHPRTTGRGGPSRGNTGFEMKQSPASRILDLLAALSHHTNMSVGCYCENEERCHRVVLRELLAEHGADIRST